MIISPFSPFLDWEYTTFIVYHFECKFLVKWRGSYSIEFTISTILIVHQLLWIKINRDNKWWGERGGGKKEKSVGSFFDPKSGKNCDDWERMWDL